MAPDWFWTTLFVVAIVTAVLAILIGHVSLRAPAAALRLYRRHFPESRHERLFLASVSFFLTFLLARGITHAIALRVGPFANVHFGSVHIHHLVWGILALLGVGLCWLGQIGGGAPGASPVASRITALLYGAGAALALDEFAIWLLLEDVYWTPQGRLSVHVVLLFGSLLAVLTGGGRFFHAVVRESLLLLGRRER
jgi:hypothetical protein